MYSVLSLYMAWAIKSIFPIEAIMANFLGLWLANNFW